MIISWIKKEGKTVLDVAVLCAILVFGVYCCNHHQSGPEANRTVKSWTDLGVSTGSIKTSRFDRTVTISPEVNNATMDSRPSSSGSGEARTPTARGGVTSPKIQFISILDRPRNLNLKWDYDNGQLVETNYGFDFRPGINFFKSIDDEGAGLDFRFAHAWNFGAQVGVEAFQKGRKLKPSVSVGYNLSYIKLRNTDIVVTYAFKDVLLGLRVEL